MDLVVCEAREQYEKLRKEEQMTKQDEHVRKQVLDKLESYEQLAKEEHLEGESAFADWIYTTSDIHISL